MTSAPLPDPGLLPSEPLCLGVDPDSSYLSWAVCTLDRVVAAGMVKVPTSVTGYKAVTQMARQVWSSPMMQWVPHVAMVRVEGQYLNDLKKGEGLLKLAAISGAVVAHCAHYCNDVSEVSPMVWTGSYNKEERMKRIPLLLNTSQEQLGQIAGCTTKQANHIVDAAGIARFCLKHPNAKLERGAGVRRRRGGGRRRRARRAR